MKTNPALGCIYGKYFIPTYSFSFNFVLFYSFKILMVPIFLFLYSLLTMLLSSCLGNSINLEK